MTTQHILYIPAIFVLGLVSGFIINNRRLGLTTISSMVTAFQNDPLQRKTSSRKLFLTFLVFFLVFVVTHMTDIPLGSKAISQLLGGLEIFDKRPAFSSIEVYSRINQFPVEGLIAYKRFTYTIDIIFPLSFFAFLLTLARFVSQRVTIPKYSVSILIGLPFFWFASDLIENAVIYNILSKFPGQIRILANLLGPITAMKFGFLLFSIFMPSLLLLFAKNLPEPTKDVR